MINRYQEICTIAQYIENIRNRVLCFSDANIGSNEFIGRIKNCEIICEYVINHSRYNKMTAILYKQEKNERNEKLFYAKITLMEYPHSCCVEGVSLLLNEITTLEFLSALDDLSLDINKAFEAHKQSHLQQLDEMKNIEEKCSKFPDHMTKFGSVNNE